MRKWCTSQESSEPTESLKRQKGILPLPEPSNSSPMFMFSRPDQ